MTAPHRPAYLRAWAHLPRNLGFLLAGLPIAVAGFVVVITLVVTGAALAIIWVGIPIGIAGLLVARGFGTLDLRRLDAAGQASIGRPKWAQAETRRPPAPADDASRAHWLALAAQGRHVLGDGRYWVYVAYVTTVNFALSIVSWVFAVVWAAGAAGGLTYWIWGRFAVGSGDEQLWLHSVVWAFIDPRRDVLEPTLEGRLAGEAVFSAICGVVFLATLPLVASAFTAAHHAVARGMLGEWRSVSLERRANEAEASRESAVIAEDRGLRRLERDIHDGPQQRLIRLQFDLASAQRRLADDPAAADALIAGALQQSKEALEELRELSRGFAPPILQDRGLEAAVLSLAARSPLTVSADIQLTDAPPTLSDVERSAYFIVSELLTNAAKHANAARASIALSVSRDTVAGPDATAGGAHTLNLLVTDDGHGGAIERPGHGLAGVRERLAGLRGSLSVTSPVGGPTTIAARIPLPETRG